MHWRHAIIAIAAAAPLAAASYAAALPAPSEPPQAVRAPAAAWGRTPAQARGLVMAGLKREAKGPCGAHLYRAATARRTLCTHGPDAAPGRIDVTMPRDLAQLSSTASAGAAAVPCIGDGVGGARVQAIYAVASDRPDRYADVKPLIEGWAGQMDAAVNQSAAETGGERHIRFVTGSGCTLSVAHVVLTPTGDDTFANSYNELWALGYNRSDRKYLIWADANVYCGIGEAIPDDRAGSTNPSNTNAEFARVDTGCWGRTDHLSELHELMHNLGAVQLSAPHSTGGFHCTDESDVMCYADAAGVALTYPCAAAHEQLLDCNHDDYFHTNPAAGSYLATHWNTATSVFLEAGGASGGTQTASLALARSASPATYSAVGQTIAYGYTLTNTGNVTLGPGQFTLSDTRANAGAPFACGAASLTLAPGATVACSAGTTVTQADLDAGSVTSSATATGGGAPVTAAVVTTVTAVQVRGLALSRTASPTTYSAAGETIAYGYTLRNSGTVTLGPDQFAVSDTRVAGGAPFACGGAPTTLAPGATLACSAATSVTQADVDTGSVTSTATATGGGAGSAAATVTVTSSAQPAPTTTTLTGSVSSKRPTKAFTLTVGDGATVNALQFSAGGRNKTAATLTLRVLRPDGSLAAGKTGPSVVQLATAPLPRGTYTWEVSGTVSASFTLNVTHTTP